MGCFFRPIIAGLMATLRCTGLCVLFGLLLLLVPNAWAVSVSAKINDFGSSLIYDEDAMIGGAYCGTVLRPLIVNRAMASPIENNGEELVYIGVKTVVENFNVNNTLRVNLRKAHTKTTGPVSLVLAAHTAYSGQSVSWRINLEPGINLKTVYLFSTFGYMNLDLDQGVGFSGRVGVSFLVPGQSTTLGDVEIISSPREACGFWLPELGVNSYCNASKIMGLPNTNNNNPNNENYLAELTDLKVTSFTGSYCIKNIDIDIDTYEPDDESFFVNRYTNDAYVLNWNSEYSGVNYQLLEGAVQHDFAGVSTDIIYTAVQRGGNTYTVADQSVGQYRYKLVKDTPIMTPNLLVSSTTDVGLSDDIYVIEPPVINMLTLSGQPLTHEGASAMYVSGSPNYRVAVPFTGVDNRILALERADTAGYWIRQEADRYNIISREFEWDFVNQSNGDYDFRARVSDAVCEAAAIITEPLDWLLGRQSACVEESLSAIASVQVQWLGQTIQFGANGLEWNGVDEASYYVLEEYNGTSWQQVYAGNDTQWSLATFDNNYRVKSCANEQLIGCTNYALLSGVQSPPSPVPNPKIIGFGNDTIGSLEGKFRVNEAGAATYSIPIMAAAGTAGVAPSISLNYSSQAGNGIAGKGWSIGGSSAITRCRQTLQIDGQAKPISLSDQDRFCLNGQRLLVDSGYTYGEVGAVYRTEINSFQEITTVGGVNGDPQYFEVVAKNLSVKRYGYNSATNHSKYSLASGTTNTWAISDNQDSFGNPLKYEYINDHRGFALEKVYYAFGASTASNTTMSFVQFNYSVASNSNSQGGYIYGQPVFQNLLLSSIESFVEHEGATVLLRKYKLNYSSASVVSEHEQEPVMLASIEECVVADVCKTPTFFDWTTQVNDTTQVANFDRGVSGHIFDSGQFADINGDGQQDIIWLSTAGGRSYLNYALNTQTGYVKTAFTDGSMSLDIGAAKVTFEVVVKTIDYNADGRRDVLISSEDFNETFVLLATPTDVGWRLTSSRSALYNFNSELIEVFDFNKDGLDDIYQFTNTLRPICDSSPTNVFLYHVNKNSNVCESFYLVSNNYNANIVTFQTNAAGWSKAAGCPVGTYYKIIGITFSSASGAMSFFCNNSLSNIWGADNISFRGIIGNGISDEVVEENTFYIYPLEKSGVASANNNYFELGSSNSGLGGYEHLVQFTPISFESQRAISVDGNPFSNTYSLCDKQAGGNEPWCTTLADVSAKVYTLGDINGDGHLDIFATGLPESTDGTLSQASVFIATGLEQGWVEYSVTNDPRGADRDTVSTADLNGDGKQEFYWREGNQLRVIAWDEINQQVTSPTTVYTQLDGDPTIMDMDGDGRLDLVTQSGTNLNVYSQMPFLFERKFIEAITDGNGAVIAVNYEMLADGISYSDLDSINADVTLGDFYTAINDPFGSIPLDQPSLRPELSAPILPVNGSLALVANVEQSAPSYDVASGQADLTTMQSTSFHYHGLRIQGSGRGYLGFKEVTRTNDQTGVSKVTEYRQDFPFIGLAVNQETRLSDGSVVSRTTNEWGLFSHERGEFDTGLTVNNDRLTHPWLVDLKTEMDAGTNGCAVLGALKPYLSKSTTIQYAANTTNDGLLVPSLPQQTVVTTTTADVYGNTLSTTAETYTGIEHVDNLLSSRMVMNTYDSSEAEKYGKVSSTTISTQRFDSLAPTIANGFEYEITEAFTYYSIANGGKLKTRTTAPGSINQISATQFYNSFGNVEQVDTTTTNAVNGGYPSELAPAMATRTLSYVYDSLGRYLNQSRNNKGQLVQNVLARNTLGQSTQISDIEGVVTETQYTSFGRPFLSYSPTGAYTNTRYFNCTQTNCPSGAVYGVETSSAGGGQSTEYFDLLGRTIQTSVRHFDGDSVSVIVQYDKLGRIARQSVPHFTDITSSQFWTETTYDELGRVSSAVAPGAFSPVTTSIIYDDFSTITVRSGNSSAVSYNVGVDGSFLTQSTTETRNALGETISVFDNLNGEIAYVYDAQGNLKLTTTHASSMAGGTASSQAGPLLSTQTIELFYDDFGRKVGMNDPDKGVWDYEYNGFGELIHQTDGNGNHIYMAYDNLGRLVRRQDWQGDGTGSVELSTATLESDTNWVYDNSGPGRLDSASDIFSNYSQSYGYDTFGRQNSITTTAGVYGSYTQRSTFDQYGRLFQQFDGSAVNAGWQYRYNASGYLLDIHDAQTVNGVRKRYSTILAMTPRGQIEQIQWGNGAVTTRTYEPERGLPLNTQTQYGFFTLQNITTQFDDFNNLVSKHNLGLGISANQPTGLAKNLKETFAYDGLNRLRTVSLNGSLTQSVDYDSYGNIVDKSDVGSYRYAEGVGCTANGVTVLGSNNFAGSHAVTSVVRYSDAQTENYCYDRNGNLLVDTSEGSGRIFTYSAFNKPTTIIKGDHTTEFAYGPARSRFLRVDTNASDTRLSKTTVYVGSFEKIIHSDNRIEFKRTMGGSVLITDSYDNASDTAATSKVQYLIKNYLGSTELVLGEDTANPVEADLSFDAWGKRRESDSWSNMTLQETLALRLGQVEETTNRGFTGHETLDEVGIIHMNGRIYDARLGRFLQADPFIQAPFYTQSYNRYAYGWNNPLNGVDPSGYSVLSEIKDAGQSFVDEFKRAGKELDRSLGSCKNLAYSCHEGDADYNGGGVQVGTSVDSNGNTTFSFGQTDAYGNSSGFNLGFTTGNGSSTYYVGYDQINVAYTSDGAVSSFTARNGNQVVHTLYSTQIFSPIYASATAGIQLYGSASGAQQNRANEIAAEITDRGYIKHKGEADYLYELNTDPNLSVNLDASHLTVDTGEFAVDKNGNLSATGSVRGFPFGQGGIHGNVTVVNRQDGTYGIYNSRYDFDIKPWRGNVLRNLNTLLGPTSCSGCGTGYNTNFYGNVNIGN